MNPDLDEGSGGHFVPHRRKERDVLRTAADLEPLIFVAPKGDRLIIFEADALAHGVEAYRDAAYWRYALTGCGSCGGRRPGPRPAARREE